MKAKVSLLSYGCLIAKSVHEFKDNDQTYFCNVRIKDRGVVGKLDMKGEVDKSVRFVGAGKQNVLAPRTHCKERTRTRSNWGRIC